jgi:hypothetical protein
VEWQTAGAVQVVVVAQTVLLLVQLMALMAVLMVVVAVAVGHSVLVVLKDVVESVQFVLSGPATLGHFQQLTRGHHELIYTN